MEYRQLGRSGLKVSVLSLGTMTFGGKGNFGKTGATDVEGARRQVDLCLEAGINLFDTADVYSEGESEKTLGQSFKNLNIARKDVVLATKAYSRIGPGRNDTGASRGHIMDAVEASLRRLQTDVGAIRNIERRAIGRPARGRRSSGCRWAAAVASSCSVAVIPTERGHRCCPIRIRSGVGSAGTPCS